MAGRGLGFLALCTSSVCLGSDSRLSGSSLSIAADCDPPDDMELGVPVTSHRPGVGGVLDDSREVVVLT